MPEARVFLIVRRYGSAGWRGFLALKSASLCYRCRLESITYLMLPLRIFLLTCAFIATPLKAAVTVSVGIEPMRYLLEQVGGERVVVSTLLNSGDPHALDPTPAQLLSLKKADLYFAVGLPFEHSLGERLGNVDHLVWLDGHDEHGEVEQVEVHDHSHAMGLDPHRWTSPDEMLHMGEIVGKKLIAVDPDGAAYYDQRLLQFQIRVENLQQDLRQQLLSSAEALVAVHPAWGWFCEEFSLNQLSVEREGKLPSIRQMSALKKEVKASGARVVVSEHDGNQAKTLASRLDLQLLVANPLSYEWEESLRNLAEGLAKP